MLRLILMCAAVAAAVTGCHQRPTSQDASAVVKGFYSTYIAHRQGGLPSGADLQRLLPFLSDNLNRMIVDALAYQRQFIDAHPNEPPPNGPPIIYKPPFVDGDYFSSLFEGPRSFEVVRVVPESDHGSWMVGVRFRYKDYSWEDTVVVVDQRGACAIDDVLFSGVGSFNLPGRLSHVLTHRDQE